MNRDRFPVPVDVTGLIVRRLRIQFAAVTNPAAELVKVSTETGRGHDGGPPSTPLLLVAEDGHRWDWPAVQRTVIRLTCRHRDTHTSRRLAGIALGLLCSPQPVGRCCAASPSPRPSLVSTPAPPHRRQQPA